MPKMKGVIFWHGTFCQGIYVVVNISTSTGRSLFLEVAIPEQASEKTGRMGITNCFSCGGM